MLTTRHLRLLALRGFTYFGMAYYSLAIVPVIGAASGTAARTVAGETNLASTIAQSIILAGLLAAFARRPRQYAGLLRPVLPLLAIATLAVLSTLWSPDPLRTLRRAVGLSECFAFGLFCFRTDGLDRTVRRIAEVCVVMAVLSLVVFVAVPSVGRETALGYERALRGVFAQKNSMSECMLLGLCCLLATAGRSWRRFAAIGLLGLCLLLGRGASAIAVAGVIGLVIAWLRLAGHPVARLALALLVAWSAAAAAVALFGFPAETIALLGRDLSLTGRVPLWQAVLPEIARAPLLGHGYVAFWDPTAPAVRMIWRFAGWEAPDAHSSLLDILLQLGVVGLALYAWAFAALFRRTARAAGFPHAAFAGLYGIALLLLGTDEGVLPVQSLWLVLFPVTLLALQRHKALAQAAAPPLRPSAVVRTIRAASGA